jgi:hypothetical protein
LPFLATFSAEKKKKIWPLGVAAIHPNGQEERDPATPSGHFCLWRTQKKKKKKKSNSLKNRF